MGIDVAADLCQNGKTKDPLVGFVGADANCRL